MVPSMLGTMQRFTWANTLLQRSDALGQWLYGEARYRWRVTLSQKDLPACHAPP